MAGARGKMGLSLCLMGPLALTHHPRPLSQQGLKRPTPKREHENLRAGLKWWGLEVGFSLEVQGLHLLTIRT